MIKIKFERYVNGKECIKSGGRLVESGLVDREVFKLPIASRIVEDIDGGKLITRDVVELPELDITIPTSSLAGGTQALMYLLSKPKVPIRLRAFGWNCYKYIWEISKMVDYDLYFSLTGGEQSLYDNSEFRLKLNEDDPDENTIYVINDGSYIRTQTDFLSKMEYLRLKYKEDYYWLLPYC